MGRLKGVKIEFIERQSAIDNKNYFVMFNHNDFNGFGRDDLDFERYFLLVLIVVKSPVLCWGQEEIECSNLKFGVWFEEVSFQETDVSSVWFTLKIVIICQNQTILIIFAELLWFFITFDGENGDDLGKVENVAVRITDFSESEFVHSV